MNKDAWSFNIVAMLTSLVQALATDSSCEIIILTTLVRYNFFLTCIGTWEKVLMNVKAIYLGEYRFIICASVGEYFWMGDQNCKEIQSG